MSGESLKVGLRRVRVTARCDVRIARMRLVNGYYRRNCADVELAKKGMDPAHPGRKYSGGEVCVPPPPEWRAVGVNRPEPGASLGGRLNLRA
jgi:hypothetical protein